MILIFATGLQYSVSIDFLQNIFKAHRTISFSPRTWGCCWIMLNPYSLDAIVELLSIFLTPPFFLNHFTLLDPWKYFNFVGTKELFHFARIRKLFHQRTTQIFFGTKELLHFARTVAGTRELLNFFKIKELLYFWWIHVWNQGTTQFFTRIQDLLNFARIKDLLNFTFLESRIS